MKIYTRKGDQGKTRLKSGKEVRKNNQRIEAYGSVDELNAALGCTLSSEIPELIKDSLLLIQDDLFLQIFQVFLVVDVNLFLQKMLVVLL